MQIAHISDSHISEAHPHRINDLKACVDSINSLADLSDIVIHTGDVAHDALAQEYKSAKEQLDQLKSPYFVMPGNRDKRNELVNAFAQDQRLFQNNGYVQYCIEDYPIQLIILDTLSNNTNKGELDSSRLDHLQQLLELNSAKPTAIFMHHTPFRVDAIPDPLQFANWSEVDALANILDQQDQICGIYCGHIHRSIKGELGRHSVSAISCMATDLRKGELTDAQRRAPMLHIHNFSTPVS